MSGRLIEAAPLTPEAFAAFGEVIAPLGPATPINGGMTDRFHALAPLDIDGRAGVSLARGRPYRLPLALAMVERHPLGSQAWIPLGPDPFLVVVAPDEGGTPGRPRAFLTAPGQGVNYRRGVWHGVLTPVDRAQDFVIIDRLDGEGNLEEHWFAEPWTVTAA